MKHAIKISDDNYDEDDTSATINETTSLKATKRKTIFESHLPSIEEILQESIDGKIVLDFYTINHVLTNKHRLLISECIVKYLMQKDMVPHREDFASIADRIVEYFKTEDKVRSHYKILRMPTFIWRHIPFFFAGYLLCSSSQE